MPSRTVLYSQLTSSLYMYYHNLRNSEEAIQGLRKQLVPYDGSTSKSRLDRLCEASPFLCAVLRKYNVYSSKQQECI